MDAQRGGAGGDPGTPQGVYTRAEVKRYVGLHYTQIYSDATVELLLTANAALDMPFLLLPFRPASDPSAARTFIRNFFSMEKGADLKGARLEQELILTEPMVS